MSTSVRSSSRLLSSSRPSSPRPKSGKIPAAVDYSGISRSVLYGLAAKHPGLFVKLNGATIVIFDKLDEIIDGLPEAEIKG